MRTESKTTLFLICLFVLSLGFASTTVFQHRHSSHGSLAGAKIGVITLDGAIEMADSGGFMGPAGAESVIREIQEMEKDKDIDALMIRINSPGGTVGASQEIYAALASFKQKRDIPLIASIGDVGASGAYWIALGTDTIFANPGSMIGSIGVILSNFDFTGLGEKYGVGINTIKGGKYKDVMSPWRPMTNEEKVLLQGMVDDVHNQFITLLKERRSLSEEQARYLADGQIFSGQQALECGLIDKIGGRQEAVAYLLKLLGKTGEPVFIRKGNPGVNDFFKLWDFVGLAPNLKKFGQTELH